MPFDENPIRVGMVLYRDDLGAGGSFRLSELLANHFDPSLVEAHLIFAYGEPGPVGSSAAVPCHYLRASNSRDVRRWRSVRSYIQELKPDILHFQHPVY